MHQTGKSRNRDNLLLSNGKQFFKNASAGGNSRDVRKLVKAKAHGNEKEEADNLILQRHGKYSQFC